MKTPLIFLFSIFILPLFGQKNDSNTKFYFFKTEATIDGKYYARSLVANETDTITIKHEAEKPKYTTKTIYHPRTQKFIKTEQDTIIHNNYSGKCLSDTVTTHTFYNIKPDQKTRNELVCKEVVKIPAYTSIEMVEKTDRFGVEISMFPAVYVKTCEAVRTGLECRVVTESEMMEQTRGRLSNCEQNQHIIIKQYYEVVEPWTEQVIIIDENARQYLEKTYYKQTNDLKRVEVLQPETKLVKAIQKKLKKDKLYNGKITGKLDFETQTAILEYQKMNNLPQGQLNLETIGQLQL